MVDKIIGCVVYGAAALLALVCTPWLLMRLLWRRWFAPPPENPDWLFDLLSADDGVVKQERQHIEARRR